MQNNKIIIEFTGLQWSWKTTILSNIEKKIQKKDMYIFKDTYLIKSRCLWYIHRVLILFLYPFQTLKIILIAIQLRKNIFINSWILSYIFYKKYLTKNICEKFIIYDEFYLHTLFSMFINSQSENKKIIDKNILYFPNIYPIHFNTSYEKNIERTKKRNKIKYDKLPDLEKRKLLEKNWYLSEYVVKKYCKLTNKPYLEVDGDASIEEKVKQVMTHIEYIKKINWL